MKTILFPIAANSISIVVPVYNSWKSAKRCIESVAAQRVLPREIIIVDDGSATSAPNLLKETLKDCNATFIQFSHQGISAARNSGLNLAKGEMVLFIDSDCILKNSTIEELIATVNQHPLNMTFQLRIGGDISRLIGKAEQIYQTAIQDILYQSDGSIRWLNTAGFAVRRQYAKQFLTLFDETIKRGEDTFLLAQLLKTAIRLITSRIALLCILPICHCFNMCLKHIRGQFIHVTLICS